MEISILLNLPAKALDAQHRYLLQNFEVTFKTETQHENIHGRLIEWYQLGSGPQRGPIQTVYRTVEHSNSFLSVLNLTAFVTTFVHLLKRVVFS